MTRSLSSVRFPLFVALLAAAFLITLANAAPGARAAAVYSDAWGDAVPVDQVRQPWDIAIGSSNSMIVLDRLKSRVVRFSSAGAGVDQVGSLGSGDGQLSSPSGLDVDASGNIYVADTVNDRVVVFDSTLAFVRSIGTSGSGSGQLDAPTDVAFDPASGDIFVVDAGNSRIAQFHTSGVFVTNFGAAGTGDAEFASPTFITICGGDLVIADSGNFRVEVVTTAGVFVRSIGSSGTGDGQFTEVNGLACNSANDHIFAMDDRRVQEFNATGTFQVAFGDNGTVLGTFATPRGIAVRGDGKLAVADSANKRAQLMDLDGSSPAAFGEWLTVSNAPLDHPWGVSVAGDGDVLVADHDAGRVQRYDADGTYVTTYAGCVPNDVDVSAADDSIWILCDSGQVYALTDAGTPIRNFTLIANASTITGAQGFDVDGHGRLLVADTAGNRILNFSDTGVYIGEMLANPALLSPKDVVADATGDNFTSYAYVANGDDSVAKLCYTLCLNAHWGTTGSGDGQFSNPIAIDRDRDGNLYVADSGNDRVEILDSTGAFVESFGVTGSGNGQFTEPDGIAVSPAGWAFIADNQLSRVARWTSDLTVPDTSISSATTSPTRDTTPTIAFAAVPAVDVDHFQCSVDGGAWATCSSPFTASTQSNGSHTLAVRAVDRGGNIDASPGSRTIVIDTVAPTTRISAHPRVRTRSHRAAFTFTATGAPVAYQCRLDSGSWKSCTSAQTYGSLHRGLHVFRVRARDALGNLDATPATFSWRIIR